jgi:hypothetical protein
LLTLSISGSAVLVTRLAVRLRTVGIRQFCGDDYITLLVLLCYVGDAVTVDRTYVLGTNVDFTQEWIMRMTPHERQHVITGSKLELLAWYSYTALIWALKACMLFFFGRLTNGLSMQTYVRYLSIVIGLSYVAVFLTITCGCLPIEKNWQITPDPGLKCTVSTRRAVHLPSPNAADLCPVQTSNPLRRLNPQHRDRRSHPHHADPNALESKRHPPKEGWLVATPLPWHLRHRSRLDPSHHVFTSLAKRPEHQPLGSARNTRRSHRSQHPHTATYAPQNFLDSWAHACQSEKEQYIRFHRWKHQLGEANMDIIDWAVPACSITPGSRSRTPRGCRDAVKERSEHRDEGRFGQLQQPL